MWTKAWWALLASALVGSASVARAGDVTYSFDNLTVGTAVTDQYLGVTFSVLPQSCLPGQSLYVRIQNPEGGTSSGSRALKIDQGCPDFSPDYIRMVFDNMQSRVSFTLGDYAATYSVRTYSVASGGAPISTQTIIISGAGAVGVHRVVTVTSATTSIKRIEIETPIGVWEAIDDLTFDVDSTPPIAAITNPSASECVCGSITVTGTANDPDGTYLRDTLQYRPSTSSTWTTIGTASHAVTNGSLYAWNTAALPEGLYFLRLTVENSAGGVTTAETVAWVSQNFDTVTFSVPSIVGGSVCPDGTAFDNWCGTSSYAVEYSVSGSGTWHPVVAGTPTYPGSKINEQLATWNTLSPLMADGSYLLRVRGTNPCADTKTLVSDVIIVDNTDPIAVITTPLACIAAGYPSSIQVRGSVADAHLASWSLWYTGGDATGWVQITPPTATQVIDGLLGTWNTAGLRPCAYTLKLVATDQATVNCNSAIANTTEYTRSIDLACWADYDRSGVLAVQDIFDFLNGWFAGCPH
jgi:hypothetical protein